MSANSPSDGLVSVQLDRREFIGTLGMTAGAVIAASVAPLAARAASDVPPAGPAPAPAIEPLVLHPAADGWDVDDMWGQRPRYAHPIPYAHGIPGGGALERSGPYSVPGGEP